MMNLRIGLHNARGGPGPVTSFEKQIFPAGSNAHQNVRLIMTGAMLFYRQSNSCRMHQIALQLRCQEPLRVM
jgi:hypothetical protein